MPVPGLEYLIWAWLNTHHYPEHLNVAIRQRIRVESNYDPGVVAHSGSSCLHQWVGSRRRELFAYAHTNRCPSWEKQLEFMDHELRQPMYRAVWSATPKNAFRVFTEVFSRPYRVHYARRGQRT